MATVILNERIRKDGKSYVIYYDDPFTGRRKYHKTFRRKSDAVEEERQLRLLIDRATWNSWPWRSGSSASG